MYVVTISPPDTLVSTQTEERCEEPAEGDADPTSTPRLIREHGAQGGVFCGDLMLFMRSWRDQDTPTLSKQTEARDWGSEEMNDEHLILKAAASSGVLLHKYLQNFEWKINIYYWVLLADDMGMRYYDFITSKVNNLFILGLIFLFCISIYASE